MRKLLLPLLLLPLTLFAAPESAPAQHPVFVKFATTEGEIVLTLFPDKAPLTVANFVKYVQDGHYDQTIFHRVIPGFVVQGGGFSVDFEQKPTREPIKNESDNGLRNLRGTISMARTNQRDSATSQFFINLKDNPRLDADGPHGGYAVFGKVVRGMDVVDDIAAIPTGPAGPFDQDVPHRPVMINKASVHDSLPPVEEEQKPEPAPTEPEAASTPVADAA